VSIAAAAAAILTEAKKRKGNKYKQNTGKKVQGKSTGKIRKQYSGKKSTGKVT
jgi:hypothetical protein